MRAPFKAFLLATALTFSAAPPTLAQESIILGEDDRSALTLTLYQQGFGLVHDARTVELPGGEVVLVLENMTDWIDATSLRVFGPSDLTLIEQSRLSATLNTAELLEAHVGKTVLLISTHPETGEETVEEATLISVRGGTVLDVGGRIEIKPNGRIALPALPEGLRAEPALSVTMTSTTAGEENLTFAYLTNGMGWSTNYVVTVDEDSNTLDLTGYVSLSNESGQDFNGASLRLIAGDVAKQQQVYERTQGLDYGISAAAPVADQESFSQGQSVSDRYLYTLDRPVDLAAGEAKQVALLSANDVPVERIFRFRNLIQVYSGAGEIGPQNAAIELEFDNEEEGGLGRPLPAGSIRVYETHASGEIFAGEDSIGHTAEGGEVTLNLGSAFDVTGSSRQTEYTQLSNRSFEAAQEVTLENAKDEPVTVEVIGNMPRGWQILEESQPHEVKTANQIVWTVAVPAGGEVTFNYKCGCSISKARQLPLVKSSCPGAPVARSRLSGASPSSSSISRMRSPRLEILTLEV